MIRVDLQLPGNLPPSCGTDVSGLLRFCYGQDESRAAADVKKTENEGLDWDRLKFSVS